MFDPDTFMQQTVDAPNATEFQKVPEGQYQMSIDDFDASKIFKEIKWTDKNDHSERTSVMANIPFIIQDEGVKAQLGRDKLVCDMSIFLDFDTNGALSTEKDKNIDLGRLKEALGQNKSGWTFSMLRGAGPVMGQVKHVADKKDPTKSYARVTKVVPIR